MFNKFILTINNLSAVGLFLGFFVSDIFTKLWNVGLLKTVNSIKLLKLKIKNDK